MLVRTVVLRFFPSPPSPSIVNSNDPIPFPSKKRISICVLNVGTLSFSSNDGISPGGSLAYIVFNATFLN